MHRQDVFHFVLAAMATWRVSFLLAREEGPWRIVARMRRAAGEGMPGQLLACVPCVSLWVALPLAWFVGGSWVELGVIWLALSGVAALIDQLTRPPFQWQETGENELLRPDRD